MAAIVFTLALVPVVASASNFGSTSTAGSPQSGVSLSRVHYQGGTHYVYFNAVENPQYVATVQRMGLAYSSATDLNMAVTSDHAGADVIVYDHAYGLNGAVAWVVCPGGATTWGNHPDRACHGQQLRYNLSYPAYYDTSLKREYLACHELGHTVGLRHSNHQSCMNLSITWPSLSSHDITQHINPKY